MPVNIVVPELGESVVEARIARWIKKAGETVAFGDPLVELETEKTNLEVSADRAGVLASVTRHEGEDVLVGDVIAVLDEAGATSGAPGSATPPTTPAAMLSDPATASAAAPGPKERATPTARSVAAQHAIEPGAVTGSGEAGRVMKRDVERAIAASPASPAPTAAPPAPKPQPAPALVAAPLVGDGERRVERVRMSKRRATIARNLVEVQHTAAMLTTFNEIDMGALMSLRERRKQTFKDKYGVNLGLSSFFVKAAVGALRAFPRINAEIQGDEMVIKHFYDVGIAVGSAQGLVVPVLRNADRLSFAAIEQSIRVFAKKADDGSLTLDDLRGGTFTITNGGVFGSMLSTPILNPPQVGILGLHNIVQRPVAVNGQVVIRPIMYVALTYDHRIVDGLEAVQFLVKVKEFIEDPSYLLIES